MILLFVHDSTPSWRRITGNGGKHGAAGIITPRRQLSSSIVQISGSLKNSGANTCDPLPTPLFFLKLSQSQMVVNVNHRCKPRRLVAWEACFGELASLRAVSRRSWGGHDNLIAPAPSTCGPGPPIVMFWRHESDGMGIARPERCPDGASPCLFWRERLTRPEKTGKKAIA